MATAALPNDLEAFAQITDPAQRAAIEQKLHRYIARGEWARAALAKLHGRPLPSENPSVRDVVPGVK